jgi:4-aminobutyrate aminotransferase/(S)-3-amino-2-methylpropionate transaminase
MDAMTTEDLPGRAKNIEAVMIPRLTELAALHAQIGDVRGRGAMLAIEIVEPGTNRPDAAEAGRISAACHQRGVLTLTCGTFGNVLRFLPPLVIPEALLEEALDVLAEALKPA